MFLDVEMPELSGLEVVHKIGTDNMPKPRSSPPPTTTMRSAHSDANAMDYLLKPFDQARFDAALIKARRWLQTGPGQFRQQLGSVMAALTPAKEAQDRLLVRSGESQLLVKAADIMYISAEGNYIRLHTAADEHLMRERMA
ncbi:LytTR family DNA-binding domain-containing protein [Massilia sp. B-10]|nr:LytTR family DNA-binding domain-containing protein [Massilia sp. B-10]